MAVGLAAAVLDLGLLTAAFFVGAAAFFALDAGLAEATFEPGLAEATLEPGLDAGDEAGADMLMSVNERVKCGAHQIQLLFI